MKQSTLEEHINKVKSARSPSEILMEMHKEAHLKKKRKRRNNQCSIQQEDEAKYWWLKD